MIETYYSVKNKIDEKHPIVKHPGTVNGQSFDIANCSGCRIVVLDHCEQVQIDNVQNCQIFIGASASTVYVRNCEECTIYSCSRQLRLRECFNSAFYAFTMTEVHIELSKDIVFAPFSGGFTEHKQCLDAAGLSLDTNCWNMIFDHNDPEHTNENWNILPIHDRNSPWFPDGSTLSCFGDVNESTFATNSAGRGQVGESFGMDQLLRDHNAKHRADVEESNPRIKEKAAIDFEGLPTKSSGDGVRQLGIEVALLIAAATAKGIDVSIWLTDLPGISLIPATDFNTKLTSLGLAVGIHESWEAKRELDLATSKSSLRTIFSLCGHFSSEGNVPLIDVSLFLRLSLERVEEHLRHIQLGIDPEPSSQKAIPTHKPVPPSSPRPTTLRSPIPSKDPLIRPVKAETPHTDSTPLPKPSPPTPVQQHRASTGALNEREAGRGRRSRSAERAFSVNALVGSGPRRSASVKAGDRFRMNGMSSDEFESFIKSTVQKTDLYHLIQVHLGFLKPYSIIPPRGDVVVSTPRTWLSVRDLQRAFMAARMRLTEFHVRTLMQLVREFAQNVRKITIGNDSTNTVSDISAGREGGGNPEVENVAAGHQQTSKIHDIDFCDTPVTLNGKLCADWFRHYMVHLRLHRPSIPWLEWLGGKLKKDEVSQDDKPKAFRRALAGKPYALSKDEINELLMEYELIPEEALMEEIERRVDVYAFDINGRMDFQHRLNIKLRQWKKANPGSHSVNTMAAQQEKFTEELRVERYQQLLSSERSEASITKELFWTFDLACRESKYSLHINFGEWLQEHARKGTKHIEAAKADFMERVHCASLKASRKHHFAPLNKLADCLSNVANVLPQGPQIEFRKALLAMKREAQNLNVAHGKVVSKTVFDKHFGNLLLGPYQANLQQDPTLRDLTAEARKSHEWRQSEDGANINPTESRNDFWTKTTFSDIFGSDITAALQASKEFEEAKSLEVNDSYVRWMGAKAESKKKLRQQEVFITQFKIVYSIYKKYAASQEDKLKEMKEKEDAAKKAAATSYRRWLRLRKKEMYFSKV